MESPYLISFLKNEGAYQKYLQDKKPLEDKEKTEELLKTFPENISIKTKEKIQAIYTYSHELSKLNNANSDFGKGRIISTGFFSSKKILSYEKTSSGNIFILTSHLLGKGSYKNAKIVLRYPSLEKFVRLTTFFEENLTKEVEILNLFKGEKEFLQNFSYAEYISQKACKKKFSLIVEYCNIGNLYKIFEPHTVEEETIKIIFHDILLGIVKMAEKNIFHRDLAPANILLHKNNNGIQVKLADFGLSTSIEKKLNNYCLGRYDYTSPEYHVFNYKPLIYSNNNLHEYIIKNIEEIKKSKKDDLWSFGIILYYYLNNAKLYPYLNNISCYEDFFLGDYQDEIKEICSKQFDCEFKQNLQYFIKEILIIDFNNRPSPIEAYYYYCKLFNLLPKFFELNLENSQDDNTNFPLHEAVKTNNFKKIIFLLEKGDCDLSEKNKDDKTALEIALEDNKIFLAKLILDKIHFHNELSSQDLKFIYYAAYLGMNNKIEEFLESEIDINFQNELGNTLLHAALEGNQISTIDFLVNQKKCDLNIKNNEGLTVFQYAIEKNNYKIACLLLQSIRSDPEELDNRGWALIHYAAYLNMHDKIQEFLELGIDINLQNISGDTPLHIALGENSDRTIEFLINQKKCDLNRKNNKGLTVLEYAIKKKNFKIARLLLQTIPYHSFYPQELDNVGWALIHYVAYLNMTDKIEEFLEQGVDINLQSKKGNTPLHIAIMAGAFLSAEFLINQKKCNLNIKNNEGLTILQFAIKHKQWKIVDLLFP